MIAGVNEMTSSSGTGSARAISLQFDLERNIDGAAREVQAAINASRVDLPATLRSNPTYRKANPADAPVIILALTSTTLTPGQIYDAVSNIVSSGWRRSTASATSRSAAARCRRCGSSCCRSRSTATASAREDVRAAIQASNANRPKGAIEGDGRRLQIYTQTPARRAADYAPMVVAWRNGAAVRLADVAEVIDGVEDTRTLGLFNGEPAVDRAGHAPARRQRHRDRRRRARAAARAAARSCRRDDQAAGRLRPHQLDPRLAARDRDHADDLDRPGRARRQRLPAQRARDHRSRRWRPSSRCSAPSA